MLSENQRPHALGMFAQRSAAPFHPAATATAGASGQTATQIARTHPKQAIEEMPRARIDVQTWRTRDPAHHQQIKMHATVALKRSSCGAYAYTRSSTHVIAAIRGTAQVKGRG